MSASGHISTCMNGVLRIIILFVQGSLHTRLGYSGLGQIGENSASHIFLSYSVHCSIDCRAACALIRSNTVHPNAGPCSVWWWLRNVIPSTIFVPPAWNLLYDNYVLLAVGDQEQTFRVHMKSRPSWFLSYFRSLSRDGGICSYVR
jgi:hypothetical protein